MKDVAALLAPRNVVIVGARDRPGCWADRIRGNLARFGYAGPVHAVNPRRAEVWGGPCYPDLFALPDEPDHLVVLLPAPAALDVLRTAVAAGARSATVFSSGFASDPDAEASLRELKSVAEAGLTISGPNCLGNISVPASMVTTTDTRLAELREGPVAVVGQSGGIVTSLNRVLVGRGIGTRYMVSSGNETCLTTADLMRYFATDVGVRVVLTFVESIREREDFFAACESVTGAGKHVVVLKVGQSDRARRATAGHTGAMAGAFGAFAAVAEQAGAVCVDGMDIAVETCEYLSRVPPPRGSGIGAVTVSGGVRELLLDAAARTGAQLPDLAPSTRRELARLLGEDASVDNPLDSGYAGLSDATTLARCAHLVAADPAVDVVLLQEEIVGHHEPGKEKTLQVFESEFPGATAGPSDVPIALFSMASFGLTDYARSLRDRHADLAFLQSTDKALQAVTAISRATASAAARTPPPARSPRPELVDQLTGTHPLTEPESKAVLRAYGVPTPRERLATTPDEAARAAAALRPPYVVKLVSRRLDHKSDVGGVVLGLSSQAAVRDACTAIRARHPAAEGFLVAEQVPSGIELVVGLVHDSEVGPVLMVGAGGVGVELVDDVAYVPVPCSPRTARMALQRTRVARLLAGWRGSPPCDVDAAVEAICAMGRLAHDAGDLLATAEVNPLVVGPARTGAWAVDALVVPQVTEGR